MPTYQYRALNAAGRQLRGSLSAVNENDLYYRLKAAGLDLVDAKTSRESKLVTLFAPSIKTRDLIELCVHLEQLERVGVPILDALSDIREATESVRLRDVLTDVVRDVGGGLLLSEALERHPKVFSQVFVGLIAAGEKTGRMADAFAHLTNHLKWTEEMNKRVRRALGYPAVLIGFTLVLLLILMLFLVPEMTRFLETVGVDLPEVTVALIAASEFVNAHWVWIITLPIAVVIGAQVLYRTSERFAYLVDLWVFRIPVIGTTLRKIALSRFCHFFAVMFASGIGVLQCISNAREVVDNRGLWASLDLVHDMVETGSSLTDALRSSGEFPSLVIRMVRIGEETGNLRSTLDNVAYFYDRDVQESINTMIAAIQPTLTLLIGLVMAWVVVAVLFPVFDSFSALPV